MVEPIPESIPPDCCGCIGAGAVVVVEAGRDWGAAAGLAGAGAGRRAGVMLPPLGPPLEERCEG